MKVFSRKSMLAAIASAAFAIPAYSQPSPPSERPQAPSAPQTLPERVVPAPSSSDAHMDSSVAQAIEINMAEIELGKLAATKAQNSRVKDFAAMMVNDHTKTLTRLRPLQSGSSASVKLSDKHKQTVDQLSRLSGGEFDRHYMDAMVRGHREAVAFFEQRAGSAGAGSRTSSPSELPAGKQPTRESETSSNHGGIAQTGTVHDSRAPGGEDLGAIARDVLPTTRRHLQMAEQIQTELQGSGSNPNRNPTPGAKPATDSTAK
jgi:putative membrane protein